MYILSEKKSRYNKPEAARGKLVDKHRNKLTMIKKTLRTPSTLQKKPGKFILLVCITISCELQKLSMCGFAIMQYYII